MGMTLHWNSQKGTRTENNKDYCGIGIRNEAVMCIVLDGASAGLTSGELACRVAHDMVDWFLDAEGEITKLRIEGRMHDIHNSIARQYPFDSASYLILLIKDGKPHQISHSGDCLYGQIDQNHDIVWLTKPHTLANAINDIPIASLLSNPTRHLLTRSFRAKEFMGSEISEIDTSNSDTFLIATDGFWAELNNNQQHDFLARKNVTPQKNRDDQSCLLIHMHEGENIIESHESDTNIYVKIA